MTQRDRERSYPRRSGGPGPRPRGSGRRTPPPETTGAEAEFLARSREDETELTFELTTGERLTGIIEYYDRHLIKVVRRDGPGLVVRKRHIRYIAERHD